MENMFIRILPIGLTLLMILWTILVSPYTKYGDNWALYPVIIIFLVNLVWHIYLIMSQQTRAMYVLYAIGHISVLVIIVFFCLMKISKDSL